MDIWEEHNKRVTVKTRDSLEQKINMLMVMMVKLVTKDDRQDQQFRPQVYQSNRGRGQTRCNYKSKISGQV